MSELKIGICKKLLLGKGLYTGTTLEAAQPQHSKFSQAKMNMVACNLNAHIVTKQTPGRKANFLKNASTATKKYHGVKWIASLKLPEIELDWALLASLIFDEKERMVQWVVIFTYSDIISSM